MTTAAGHARRERLPRQHSIKGPHDIGTDCGEPVSRRRRAFKNSRMSVGRANYLPSDRATAIVRNPKGSANVRRASGPVEFRLTQLGDLPCDQARRAGPQQAAKP